MSFFDAIFSIFSLHYPPKCYRIDLKVVKSGVKWYIVADNPLFVADHLTGESVVYKVPAGRVIADVHGRIQSHNRRKGQTDRPV